MKLSRAELDKSFQFVTRNDTIDFGLLSQEFQQRVVKRVLFDAKAKSELIKMNPFLKNPGHVSGEKALIENNKKLIIRHYNEEKYRDTLLSIYRNVVSTSIKHRIDKKRLLAEFFNPDSFSLLKWCDEFE
jgi:hypothetical protein